MKAKAARRGHSLASRLIRTLHSFLKGPTATQISTPVLESPKMKSIGLVRKLRHRGLERVGWMFTFTAAAYNLVRLRNLMRGVPEPKCA
jgi:hypothetical protein